MLSVNRISKSYSTDIILKEITFSINRHDRVGLVGPNGCGKSTLLRILAGEEQADSGSYAFTPSDLRWGYLKQGFSPAPGDTLLSTLSLRDHEVTQLAEKVERLAASVASSPADQALLKFYDQTISQLQAASEQAGRVPEVLAALGLSQFSLDTPLSFLSGGQKTRLGLARVLLGDPQLLMLDEPTNHLDIVMLEWLEDWLARFQGGVLVVSHDRTFLDRTVNRILDLSLETHSLKEYTGNYSAYVAQVLTEHARLQAAYQDQVYEIRRMRQDIERTKNQSLSVELTTTSRQPGVRRIAKKVAKKAKARERKLDRYLESDERVEKPQAGWQIKQNFFDTSPAGESHISQSAIRLEQVSIGYPGFPVLLQGLNLDVQAGQRIALTGPNGCGKTTLMRTIAGKMEPVSGRVYVGPSVQLGYMSQEQELLDPQLSVVDTLRRVAPFNQTEARSFLHYFLFTGDEALNLVGRLSFGERARLTLACLVAQGCNCLLLDEPINHLDIPSRTRFEQALAGFDGAILAVVHDRYFIRQFARQIWEVHEGTIQRNWSAVDQSQ